MARTKKTPKAKTVNIIARIAWKHEDKVVYLVRASKPLKDTTYILKPKGIILYNGNTYQSVARDGERYLIYQVCFVNGSFSGCQCDAKNHGVECCHKKYLVALEAERRASTPVPAPPADHVVETATTIAETTEPVTKETKAHIEDVIAYQEWQEWQQAYQDEQPTDSPATSEEEEALEALLKECAEQEAAYNHARQPAPEVKYNEWGYKIRPATECLAAEIVYSKLSTGKYAFIPTGRGLVFNHESHLYPPNFFH